MIGKRMDWMLGRDCWEGSDWGNFLGLHIAVSLMDWYK
jgi:hypothetical protein